MSASPWSRSASWRDDVHDEGPRWYDSDDEDTDQSKCREFFTPEEAGEEFVRALLELKWKHQLSAKAVCVLCFYASTAGAVGTCRDLAAHPDKGHFQRKLDKVLGTHEEDDRCYEIDIPVHVKLSDERMLAPVPFVPPHESLADEVAHDESQRQKLQTMARTHQLSKYYFEHPLVQTEPLGTVWPCSIYVDGTPFNAHDSVLGFFCVNMVSGARHLCGTLRKSTICRCGCKGWCSIYPVLQFLQWSLLALQNGTFPDRRADHHPWKPSDEIRSSVAGDKIGIKGILCRITGDWMEYCSTMGFTSWASTKSPCPFCECTHAEWFNFDGLELDNLPWPRRDETKYEASCLQCERWITLRSDEMHKKILASLSWFKSSSGPRGRALKVDMPQLGLKKNDRLEPCAAVQDVGETFDNLVVDPSRPIRICFWRRSEETAIRHRNPLICRALHSSVRTMVVDSLHCWYLGIFQRYLGHVWWQIVDHNVLGVDSPNRESLVANSVQRMRSLLPQFYRMWHEQFPLDRISELSDLSERNLGASAGIRTIRTKAAETRPLLPYTSWLIKQHPNRLPVADGLALMGLESLQSMLQVCAQGGPNLTPEEIRRMFDHLKRHFRAMKLQGIPCVPKHHASAHIGECALLHGNPREYAVFQDESYNGKMKNIAATCHRRRFHWRLLAEFRIAYGPGHNHEGLLHRLNRLRTC